MESSYMFYPGDTLGSLNGVSILAPGVYFVVNTLLNWEEYWWFSLYSLRKS